MKARLYHGIAIWARALTVIDYPEGRKRIRQEFTAQQMCEKAAKRLRLEDGKWQCFSGGFNAR